MADVPPDRVLELLPVPALRQDVSC
jgi:hypothetical protein